MTSSSVSATAVKCFVSAVRLSRSAKARESHVWEVGVALLLLLGRREVRIEKKREREAIWRVGVKAGVGT